MQRIRTHLSFANVISVIALFVALGGASYAAVTLPKNSVGAKQIKKNGVGASEIKRNAVRASEIKSNAVSTGDIADNGVGGADLADNSVGGSEVTNDSLNADDIAGGTLDPEVGPDAFARIQADGTLLPALGDFPATSKGIEAANVTHPATGVYCIDLAFRPAVAMVALDNAAFNNATDGAFSVSVATERGNNIAPCDGKDARVRTTKWTDAAAPAFTDHPFVIWFER